MKRVKHIWDDFISADNFDVAAHNAVRSKKSKLVVKKFLENRDENLRRLRQSLIDGTFQTSTYKLRKIFEPKERIIYILPLYPDHIVHHALINVLGPIWQRTFIHDSYACVPGRGLHAASRRVMDFVRRNKYVLQCDIRKFYPNMDHDVMMKIIKRKIGDKRILGVLENIVRSGGDAKNIPIGNLTSQWLGNVYLNELDHFVKEKLRWPDYIRYCDDFCLFGNDKNELRTAVMVIGRFLQSELKLCFSRTSIRPVHLGVNFIGLRHFKKFILMGRNALKRIKKRFRQIKSHGRNSIRAVQQIAAMNGWMHIASTYNFKQKISLN